MLKYLLPVVTLVACGADVEPIRQPLPLHDEPLFDIWDDDPQLGTVLVADRRTDSGVEANVVARFEPSGDRGIYSLVDAAGDCRLYSARFFCDQACDDAQCIDGQCVPYPSFVSVGELTVDGLGDRRTLRYTEPLLGIENGGHYVADQNDSVGGFLAEGEAITVSAEGGEEVAGFTAQVAGIDEVAWDVAPGEVVRLADSLPFAISWSPGDGDARVRLVLRTSETGHGLPPQEKLVCDVPDQGSLVVPGQLVGQLPEMTLPDDDVGYAGGLPQMPSGLIRYRATRVAAEGGRIEVVAAAETLFWAVH